MSQNPGIEMSALLDALTALDAAARFCGKDYKNIPLQYECNRAAARLQTAICAIVSKVPVKVAA